ncbi:MAG: DUF47 family protein [Verrucomicrobiales bacterium]|jgi:uncharacterized protein Yka (UPF0111/DUF47 family)|nr:DUF47 family protein [Verrucomicrobiales bacterium]
MFSLRRWFSNSDKFHDLLGAAAEECHNSTLELVSLLKAPPAERRLDKFSEHRRKQKRIRDEISTLLCTSFSTPIEREDIESLTLALYKIPKTVERFCERLLVSPEHIQVEDFRKQALLLSDATQTLRAMVKKLRRHADIESIRDLNEHLQTIEGEGDKLMLELFKDLYSGRHDPLTVVIRRHLYETLEKIIDRCRTTGNIVNYIVLKYS